MIWIKKEKDIYLFQLKIAFIIHVFLLGFEKTCFLIEVLFFK